MTIHQSKILVADDDPVALEMLRGALTAHGYQVETVSNGRQALTRLAQEDIRLLITDWEMPELNGLDVCREIRRNEAAGYIYVILLTSRGTSAEIVEGMSAGADDFIIKPCNHAELAARVRAGFRMLSLETRDMVIFALAKLAESRDSDTGMHLERVQRYARRLAEQVVSKMGPDAKVESDFVRLVYQTSPLHDIGKVGIPDSILLKPGRLSATEFEVMKTHTTIGANTLQAALANFPHARFLHVARDIALTHHERWDGKGYPHGLAGEDIPLAGRVVAVADVYDALTSRRVYKDAYCHDVAKNIIIEDSGKHFDPQVVDAFLAVEADLVEIGQRYAEQSELGECDPLSFWGPSAASASVPLTALT